MILRLASKFPGRRDQLLFLINNYDVVSLINALVPINNNDIVVVAELLTFLN